MSKTDVIIIGGGHNGLTAAATLAKAGRSCVLLERRAILGGLAAREEFYKGYRSAGVLWDTEAVSDQVIDALGLENHGLTRDTEGTELFVPDDEKGFILSDNVAATANELGEDGEAWRQWSTFLTRIKPVMRRLFDDLPTGIEGLSWGELIDLAGRGLKLRRLGRADMLTLMRINLLATKDYLDELFTSQRLKAALALPAHAHGTAGPYAPATTANLLLDLARRGRPLVGGAPALIGALENAAKAAGGTLRTDAEVARITVAAGKVTGVALTSGETLEAETVIATGDPKLVFGQLLAPEHVNLEQEQAFRCFRSRGTAARVRLALKGELRFPSRPDNQPTHIRIVEDLNHLERACDAIKYRRFAESPVLEVHVPSVTDATYAPPDGTSVSILAHFAPYQLDGGWTPEQREALGDAVIARLKTYAPDIEIIGRAVETPEDLARAYALSEGNLYHGEHALDQLVVRPTLATTDHTTPIEGLLLGGSGSRPGGGLTCLPGYNAAKKLT